MKNWTKAYVTVGSGELGIFPAEAATWISWNGAACSRFSRQVAEQIVQAAAEAREQAGHEDDEWLTWDGDVIVVFPAENHASAESEPERIEPDKDGMYAIGWFSWTWSAVWCEGDVHKGEPDDLVPPVAIMRKVVPSIHGGLESRPDYEDHAYCQSCLDQARVVHPQAEIITLPPL